MQPSTSRASSGKAEGGRRCAVLGHPIAHSLSPVMHRAAYQHLGLNWSYEAFDVEEADLETFVAGRSAEWRGLSLTMPLKVRAVEVATEVQPLARTLNSVNTLVLEAGAVRGYNTDVLGLQQVIEGAFTGPDQPSSASVLGAGATARSAVAALAELKGRLSLESVTVCARRSEAAQHLVTLGDSLGLSVGAGTWPPTDLGAATSGDYPLVVNTLPLGPAAELAAQVSPRAGLLVDVLYHPWPTPLAKRWTRGGGKAIGGVEMLVMQGVAQVELMTGQTVSPSVLRDAAMGELDRRNIAQAEQ